MMLCSFAVPEPRIWSHAISAPLNVPPPEELLLEEETLAKILEETKDPKIRQEIEVQIMVLPPSKETRVFLSTELGIA